MEGTVMRINHEKKTGGSAGIYASLSNGTKNAKPVLLDEFTWLTGYHRKSAIRLLSAKPERKAGLY
jgi:hypothetical protein